MSFTPIPIIDLFAGAGGLAEGFAALRHKGSRAYRIALSIEKDDDAHKTLELRAFLRSFEGNTPSDYEEYLRGAISKQALFDRHPDQWQAAKQEAWKFTLAKESREERFRRVVDAIGKSKNWVLIGGPPCQAYSQVGRVKIRSRNRKNFLKDERHFLYQEFLSLITDHMPSVFVMENVKGLLSSKAESGLMFDQIVRDLSAPTGCPVTYKIVPLCPEDSSHQSRNFIVKSELLGLPQARHRVILCGIRQDFQAQLPLPSILNSEPVSLRNALAGLPPLRSRISRRPDSALEWKAALKSAPNRKYLQKQSALAAVVREMQRAASKVADLETGATFTELAEWPRLVKDSDRQFRKWIGETSVGVTGHQSRSHMVSDLHRYLFASSFAAVNRRSPRIHDFPRELRPRHQNVRGNGKKKADFADRFRVQLWDDPSTTVLAHIAKDGHYYIHPDPSQCRSLSIREAARLQTFPDNFHFEGSPTAQFKQIGNAVPPLLANKIAQCLLEFLLRNSGARDIPDKPQALTVTKEDRRAA